MIEIRVVDPASCSQKELNALVAFFTQCAETTGVTHLPNNGTVIVGKGTESVTIVGRPAGGGGVNIPAAGTGGGSTHIGTIEPSGHFTIPPNDAPDAGAPTEDDIAAAEALRAFGGIVTQPINMLVPTPGVVPTIATPPAPPAPVPNPLGVDVDAAGLPWDERIHSSNHEKNKGDNLWRARRNVDKNLVATVEAELRAVMSIPKSPSAPPTPIASLPPAVPSVPAITASVGSGTTATAPVPQNNGLSPPKVGFTFAELVPRVMQETGAGRMTQVQVAAACAQVGLANFPSLAMREDLVPTVFAALFPNG